MITTNKNRKNRRSRRLSNYRTRCWVNQYNNIESNYGTVKIVTNNVDKCEREEQHFIQKPDGNVQRDKQYSTHGQESVQDSGETVETSKKSIIPWVTIGLGIGAVFKGLYSLIKYRK